MGFQPSRIYKPEQAAGLPANLIALRELEIQSGSLDAPVDENALARRVKTLKNDGTVKKMAEDAVLAMQKAKELKEKTGDEPAEQMLARNAIGWYQKMNPVKAPAEPEQPLQQGSLQPGL